MENIKFAAQAQENLLTLSLVTEKTESIIHNGFAFTRTVPTIREIATYAHVKKGGITRVQVTNFRPGENQEFHIAVPELPESCN